MREELHNLKNEALALIQEAKDNQELEAYRIAFLGRKGKVNSLLKKISQVEPEKRAWLGELINEIKETIIKALQNRRAQLGRLTDQFPSQETFFDPTLPGKIPALGHLHLVTQAITEISNIFAKIGFVRVRYPEIEWDWFAFEGLNMPQNHPARDEWETLFLNEPASKQFGKMVLTPQTSSGQIREMQRLGKPPIRMINIARCHRRQQDITHTLMFHQFEGLVIDKNISLAHLKGVTDYFAQNFFGPQRVTRLRPFHFSFTEPSVEVDINCPLCLGKGCRTCKSGWHELGGAGMVHPAVLKNGGFDPQKYTGFAFGWGVERTYMMKSGIHIDDLRLFYSNNLKFLEQF